MFHINALGNMHIILTIWQKNGLCGLYLIAVKLLWPTKIEKVDDDETILVSVKATSPIPDAGCIIICYQTVVGNDVMIMMTWSNGNILRLIGSLCGEFTGHRWIPLAKVSDAELWYFLFDLHLNKRLSKQSWGWWFEMPWRSLWRHCNDTVEHSSCIQFDLVQYNNIFHMNRIYSRKRTFMHNDFFFIIWSQYVPYDIPT